jgi:hypothetical protein
VSPDARDLLKDGRPIFLRPAPRIWPLVWPLIAFALILVWWWLK